MMEFLNMGGYAGYVWTSFGATVLVLTLNVIHARRQHAQVVAQLRRRSTERGQ